MFRRISIFCCYDEVVVVLNVVVVAVDVVRKARIRNVCGGTRKHDVCGWVSL